MVGSRRRLTSGRRRTAAIVAGVVAALVGLTALIVVVVAPALWPGAARGLNPGLASLTPAAPALAVEACWAAEVAPLADHVPVVMAEFGQSDGGDDHLRRRFT